jgi:predicted DCC family thiol-disulfide oxidoreductase YuxK
MASLRFLARTLSLDFRSLALYRMLMGLVVMADVLYRLPDLVNFYTDIGLVPRSIFLTEMTMPWSFSFHLASGSSVYIALLFAIHFLAAVLLFLGYKTRWAMFLVWFFTISIHNRNWLVNNGGDDILRAVLFLSIFLPLNRCFSLDSALQKPKERMQGEHFSTWGVAFFFQVFAIYFVSYILKDHPIWRRDFTAVFYASRLDIFATPIGIFTRDFPFYQKLTTIFTVYLEWLGPILLLFSCIFGRFWWHVRTFVVFAFWSLHIGIILTMWIGVFPYLCLAIWVLFLPGPFWEWVLQKYRTMNFGKLSIYFDRECLFCEKMVLILREFFLLPEVKIEQAQRTPAIYALMQEKHSWVVENENGERFFYFRAMLEVMKHSPLLRFLVPLFALAPFSAFLHHVYIWISHHRPLFGKLSQFLKFQSSRKSVPWLSWISQMAGAFILVTIVMWNLTTIKRWNVKAPTFQTVARWLHLYQEWNMFAPYPKKDNIWVEIPATLEDESVIELLSGDRDIYSVKSNVFPGNIPNEHWRKFYLNLSDKTDYARYYGGYLCREWNDRKIRLVKDQTLRKMEIIVYTRPNLENGERGGITRKLSWKHWCFDEDMKKDNATQ